MGTLEPKKKIKPNHSVFLHRRVQTVWFSSFELSFLLFVITFLRTRYTTTTTTREKKLIINMQNRIQYKLTLAERMHPQRSMPFLFRYRTLVVDCGRVVEVLRDGASTVVFEIPHHILRLVPTPPFILG